MAVQAVRPAVGCTSVVDRRSIRGLGARARHVHRDIGVTFGPAWLTHDHHSHEDRHDAIRICRITVAVSYRPRHHGRAVMDIKIDERLIGGVTVLDIAGKLTVDRAAQHLKDKINSLISQQRTDIVLNLKNVPYIDSGGLGQLVASYGSVMKTGGALKLLNVGSRNHDLLSITRLVMVFESFDSETEAVQSFETIAAPAASH
jgi:anti-sigma B factor antagonist